MNVWRLIVREIRHRKLNFALALLANAAAVACLVGAMTLLRAHEIRTEEILAEQQQSSAEAIEARQSDVQKAGADLEDSMRKITLELGFNILILPKEQDLNELHAEGTLSATMPEEYVKRLAESKIVSVNHLLPLVMKKVKWDEMNQSVVLIGTRGEVPQMHQSAKKPLQDMVPAGNMVVGHQIHKQHGLKKGDKVKLLGKEFTVAELHDERGNVDDSTVWINLVEAQELLGKQNLLNAILALECNCAAKDRVGQIRKDIEGTLPGMQVIERGSTALARAEARNKAKDVAVAALEREKLAAESAVQRETANRQNLREHRAGLASVLVPLVVGGCALLIGLLAFGNARQRKSEIGILRAIGARSVQILSMFLGKAILVGVAGAIVGYLAGFALGATWGDRLSGQSASSLFLPGPLLLAIVMAPLLSALACWIPALLAARQDPALVLQED